MKRTQIYLSPEQWQKLDTLSHQKQKSIAKLIREAIDKVYHRKKSVDFQTVLNKGFGIWKDRADISSTDKYVRKLRHGKRLERFYKKK